MGSDTASIVDVNVDKGLPMRRQRGASFAAYPEELVRGERSARSGASGFAFERGGLFVENSRGFVDEIARVPWISHLVGV
jgi:hypothetical protein